MRAPLDAGINATIAVFVTAAAFLFQINKHFRALDERMGERLARIEGRLDPYYPPKDIAAP